LIENIPFVNFIVTFLVKRMKFSQTLLMSLQSLRTNRMRTILTVLGVVVGIFSIIVIMTILTMMQETIQTGVSFLSKNTFQINKWPAIRVGDHKSWAKYRNRKDITLDEFYRLEKLMSSAKYVGAEQGAGGKIVKYGNKETNPNIYVVGVTMGSFMTRNVTISEGRPLRETDIHYSNDVCILGNSVVEKLFPNIDPIGQIVRVDRKPMKVIGTLEKQPSFFGSSEDNYIVMPITTFQSMYGRRSRSVSIGVMSRSSEDYNQVIEQAIGYMRTIRKVPPGEENDFDVFSNESIIEQISDITGGVKIGALVVSIIALIAAGVGIMNIMLVSVTERTREIGVRKAVGARKSDILIQFLLEAIILCLGGGVIGIILGVSIGNLAGSVIHAVAVVPYDWVLIGLSLCVLVGIIFGTYPAYKAANLDPIEALRYE
jgi:putative ABC transport system permease protein